MYFYFYSKGFEILYYDILYSIWKTHDFLAQIFPLFSRAEQAQ